MYSGEALKESVPLLKAQDHAKFHHKDSDGWVTVAKKTNNNKFKQYHYQSEELAEEISKWIGTDVYFSQNTFYKPQRSIHNLRNLKALYTDVDFYLLNYEPSWVLGKLEYEYFGEIIPDPNLIIFSGRGIVLIWLLEPVPYQALSLWQAVQDYFLKQLSNLGADPQARDAARLFRIAGSVNSKSGEEVYVTYRHDYRYELRQIQFDFLPDLNEVVNPPKKKKKGRKKKTAHLFNVYRLHYERLLDIVNLVELRNYEMTGYRELTCFLYRYWSCFYIKDPSEALNYTSLLNSEFTNPLPESELIRATKSAERAYEEKNDAKANEIAINKGYPGAGYNISNKKIIEWLNITEEEQQHLSTIIDANEKRRRKRLANMETRREQGVKPREKYLNEQQKKTDENLTNLARLIHENPKATRKELAESLGVTPPRITQLKKLL